MHFGITFPSYVDSWRDCEVAEAAGFSHAWFYDTQLLCSDVYATMALAAEHTKTMVLGTLVAIPSNRIAPVTASAIATINAIAPGRVILGLGTGFTGRNTMGLPPLPVSSLIEYTRQVRGLLAGEDVLFREGKAERWIRLLSADRRLGCVNLDDPIPIHIAANAPKALAAVGEVGDGWITASQPSEAIGPSQERIVSAAREADRSFSFDGPGGRPYTTLLTTACVLQPGEAVSSERVLRRVGPVVVVAAHAIWESSRDGFGFGIKNDEVASAYDAFLEEYAAKRGSPRDRRYLEAHEGHMMYLKPGEEAFVIPELIPAMSLTGDAGEVRERVRALADAGVDNLAVQVIPGLARELIEEFGREVIGRV
ncbi:MAG: LLM class flavin-dependent oxidoreductase [Deltaproteobacteria bacterium]|nr:LLM class flavin-dependent oxidoreductase [Deltaproteobacteria bacterium]